MPVIFREKDRVFWKQWLPPDLGDRLDTIRQLVIHLHETKEHMRQLKWFTPHGEMHCRAVETMLHRLIPGKRHKKLSEDEKFFLLASAWLHDIGMLRGLLKEDEKGLSDSQIRDDHHIRSEKYLARDYHAVGVKEPEREAFGLLARFHRRRCQISKCPETFTISGQGSLRLRLLAAYLRLADALHVDQTRTPADQYAISLTYDIPSKCKLHWLRSKFVLGIDIDVEKKREIAVHLKYPVNIDSKDEHDRLAMQRTLEDIYDVIVQDLSDELDSVKNVLFSGGISYFLSVTKVVHEVEFDLQFLRDIKSVLNYYFLIDNPSSSALISLVLQSIWGIIDSRLSSVDGNEDVTRSLAINAVISFLDEIDERVLGSRQCHTGLRNFVRENREKLKSGDIKDLKGWVDSTRAELKKKRRDLRHSAYRYFSHVLLPLNASQGVAGDNVTEHKDSGNEEKRSIPVYDILVYGYSELVIKALCGFRDAILRKLVMEKYCGRDRKAVENVHSKYSEIPLFHKVEFEKEASQRFRIFVCEGQPKNRTAWGGRMVYHDGSRYALSLVDRGFTNTYIIPDAIASSLIWPHYDRDGIPKIDFVMLGANGFDKSTFLHSAGHAMAVAVTSFAKTLNCASSDDAKKRMSPTLVLAVITDKYGDGKDHPSVSRSCARIANESEKENEEPISVDEWWFQDSFAGEPVRNHMFISQDVKLHEALTRVKPRVLFYNPREDSIPISYVDVIITEKAWLAKDKENENNWNGHYFATHDKDSIFSPRGSR